MGVYLGHQLVVPDMHCGIRCKNNLQLFFSACHFGRGNQIACSNSLLFSWCLQAMNGHQCCSILLFIQ